jgi:predicted RecA/RadA family phage recombinase
MAKNKVQEGKVLLLALAAGTKSGAPVVVGGLHGVALIDADATTNKATVDLTGVYDLSVKAVNDAGNSAVAEGEAIYYVAGDTPKLSKKSSGTFFGFAVEAITSGSTDTINVLVVQSDTLAAIGAGAVTKTMLAGGFLKAKVLAGGAAGDHTLAGIAVGDELVTVARLDIDTGTVVDISDITAEFTVAAGKITNVGGTDTTGDKLLVLYLDLTA